MHSTPSNNDQSTRHAAPSARRSRVGVLIGRLALVLVLGLAFVGYLTPGMRIQWANLMTLCGF